LAELEEMLAGILTDLRPLPETLAVCDRVSDMLVKGLEEVFGPGRVSLEGSYAKGTMVRGREEVDVFIHFDRSKPVEEAAQQVLAAGTELVKRLGGSVRLRYASHPYVEGFVEGVRVNVVPCYDTEPGKWITPVDRTPYHTRYVKSMLDGRLADEVRLLKAFLMNDGIYGAEIKTRGFSGYACELLIIRYGSFLKLLRAASEWRLPVVLDGHERLFPNQPMVLTDPVDETRNVTAAVSTTSLSKFILKAKLFLRRPSPEYFSEKTRLPAPVEGRQFVAVVFDVPDEPPDILWGELGRTLEGLAKALAGSGFKPYRSGCSTDGRRAVLLYELETLRLPETYLHVGPPVWSRNAVEFVEEQLRKKDLALPPWVDGERLYSLRRRRYVEPIGFLRDVIEGGKASVSKTLIPRLRNCTVTADVAGLKAGLDGELREFLEEFIAACPSFIATYFKYQ
jgi:tRNA nucleotidyltransferase (CCA-adding enzyme)